MVIKHAKRIHLRILIFILLCVMFSVQGWTTPARAAEDSFEEISVAASDFQKSEDGSYYCQAEVSDFDHVTVSWTSTGEPVLSMRTRSTDSDVWDDWYPITKSGQKFLRRMGGLLSLPSKSSESVSVILEIRAENMIKSELDHVVLTFSKSQQDTTSTLIAFIVMLAAGGAFYIKKRRT